MKKPNRFRDTDDFLDAALSRIERYESQLAISGSDPEGHAASTLSIASRGAAIMIWYRRRDPSLVREVLLKGARAQLSIYCRSDAGENLSPSYLGFLQYQAVFAALAGGDTELAEDLARRILARVETAPDRVHAFDRALCMALCSCVTCSTDAEVQIRSCNETLSAFDLRHFAGYGHALLAIQHGDALGVKAALDEIVEWHQSLGTQGIWRERPERELSIWGIGTANLARARGLKIDYDHEFIPRELLV